MFLTNKFYELYSYHCIKQDIDTDILNDVNKNIKEEDQDLSIGERKGFQNNRLTCNHI